MGATYNTTRVQRDLKFLQSPEVISEVMHSLHTDILVYSLHLLGIYLGDTDSGSMLFALRKDSDRLA